MAESTPANIDDEENWPGLAASIERGRAERQLVTPCDSYKGTSCDDEYGCVCDLRARNTALREHIKNTPERTRIQRDKERGDLKNLGALEERARIVAIIKRRCDAYEKQDDGHGALLVVGLNYLLNEIEASDD